MIEVKLVRTDKHDFGVENYIIEFTGESMQDIFVQIRDFLDNNYINIVTEGKETK